MQSAQPTPVDVFLRTHPDRGGLCVQVADVPFVRTYFPDVVIPDPHD